MNGKQINFLINFEIFFEIRALYISAIRVVNQEFNFASSLKFDDHYQETSNLITNLNLENNVNKRIEDLIFENISTIKPKLFFTLNMLSLSRFLSKRSLVSFYLYYDRKLLISELKHQEIISKTKNFLNSFGVSQVFVLSEDKLVKEIQNNVFEFTENYVIDFSKDTIQKIMNHFSNFTLFYKFPFKYNTDPEIENTFISFLRKEKIIFHENYDDFLKLFYNNEEFHSYKEYESNQIIFKYAPSYLNNQFDFLEFWNKISYINDTIIIKGKAVTGFKRGSNHLGVPTANIEMTKENISITKNMLSGVYFGYCKFISNISGNLNIDLNKSYKYVLSIGWNPFYQNDVKTIEVFIIDYIGEEFYGEDLQININYFLRTESNFENFGELVTAITYDIIQANFLLSSF